MCKIFLILIILSVAMELHGAVTKQQFRNINTRLSRIRIETGSSEANTNNECNCACGITNRRMRIVGGDETRVHEFPWLGSLSRQGKLYCGATLVTRRHLLTAAHCVDGFDIDEIDVSLGEHDRDEKSDKNLERRLKKIHVHSDFNTFTFNNDIAILELDRPVDFGPMLQPVCLPPKGGANYTSRVAIVAGWGRTDEKQPPTNTPRKVSVPVWSRQQCLDAGYSNKRITENMLCAGYHDGKRDACQGDSGGPMHLHADDGSMELIGVVSWGRGCARPNYPGIYTRVANYIDWINDLIKVETSLLEVSNSI